MLRACEAPLSPEAELSRAPSGVLGLEKGNMSLPEAPLLGVPWL